MFSSSIQKASSVTTHVPALDNMGAMKKTSHDRLELADSFLMKKSIHAVVKKTIDDLKKEMPQEQNPMHFRSRIAMVVYRDHGVKASTLAINLQNKKTAIITSVINHEMPDACLSDQLKEAAAIREDVKLYARHTRLTKAAGIVFDDVQILSGKVENLDFYDDDVQANRGRDTYVLRTAKDGYVSFNTLSEREKNRFKESERDNNTAIRENFNESTILFRLVAEEDITERFLFNKKTGDFRILEKDEAVDKNEEEEIRTRLSPHLQGNPHSTGEIRSHLAITRNPIDGMLSIGGETIGVCNIPNRTLHFLHGAEAKAAAVQFQKGDGRVNKKPRIISIHWADCIRAGVKNVYEDNFMITRGESEPLVIEVPDRETPYQVGLPYQLIDHEHAMLEYQRIYSK